MSFHFLTSRLKSIVNRGAFHPTFINIFTNPFYIIRKSLFLGIKSNAHLIRGKTLDFGCGSKPYVELFSLTSSYTGCDVEVSGHGHSNSKIDVFYDGVSLPFTDQSFESVVSFETFEHVFNIDVMVQELHRVLQKNGTILITIPFVWEEHEVPYDFARYSTYGIRHVFESHGFEIIKVERLGDYVDVIAQLFMSYFSGIVRSEKVRVLLTAFFQPPIILLRAFLKLVLPTSNKLFLNTLMVAKKV